MSATSHLRVKQHEVLSRGGYSNGASGYRRIKTADFLVSTDLKLTITNCKNERKRLHIHCWSLYYMYRNPSPSQATVFNSSTWCTPHCVSASQKSPQDQILTLMSHISFFCLSGHNPTFFCPCLSLFAFLMTTKLMIKTLVNGHL